MKDDGQSMEVEAVRSEAVEPDSLGTPEDTVRWKVKVEQ